MSEPAKKYLIKIAKLHLAVDAQDNVLGLKELDLFLNSENINTICAITGDNEIGKTVEFVRSIPGESTGKNVIFTKTGSNSNGSDFPYSCQVMTVTGPPTLALYQTLCNVYSPLLQKTQYNGIKKTIVSLQTELRSAILAENCQLEKGLSPLDPPPLIGTESLEDEVNYWEEFSFGKKKDKLTRRVAETFQTILKPLANDFLVIEAVPASEAEELLDKAHNTLDDLWRHQPSYPLDRIKHLMDVIGGSVWKFTIHQFKHCDIWNNDYHIVSDRLLQSISLGDKWLTTCKQLTAIFWPNYSANPWNESPYTPSALLHFLLRMKEVLNARTVHKQLLSLSTPQEQQDLVSQYIFKPFRDIDVFAYDDAATREFLKAQKEFEYLLQPAESRIARKLKKQFSPMNVNVRQLIYKFSRYCELIRRPVLRKMFQSEREYLLTNLQEYIRQIQSQSHSERSQLVTRQETTSIIKDIILIRQLKSKANEVYAVGEQILSELPDYAKVRDMLDEVVHDLKQQQNELFDSWSTRVTCDINNETLSLKQTDPVVQFSKEKLMKVNYPASLVTLVSEVRQLSAMGFHISSVIVQTSEHAQKFLKFARILEQIANFHNTIGDRMVASQKPMMLSSALEVSKLVQEQEVVSWNEEKSVGKYVDVLKRAVEKLSRENSLLTSYHIEIVDKVRQLQNTNLFVNYLQWKETIKNIRAIFDQVEQKRFKNMQTWKVDIDQRVFDIFEEQFVKNLKNVQLNLQDIHVDLVYRGDRLQFAPDHSTLEQLFEQQLEKYFNIPKHFRSLSECSNSPKYSQILDRNKECLEIVSKNKRQLFDQLNSVIKHWQSWLQVEALDTNNLRNWQDWDLHFRASKTFGQEIAKLPNAEEKVGCFLVNLSTLRADLERHNRNYWDQLIYSLKDSIAQDVVKLQNYIDPSTAILTKQPVTVDQIGESRTNYSSIMTAHEEMKQTLNEMFAKSQILGNWSREQVDSVNRLKGAWERLQSLIDNFQHIMAKQLENIKTTLNIERENLIQQMEHFEAKWNQMVTVQKSSDISDIDVMNRQWQEVKTKREEWNSIIEKKNNLVSEYEKFNLGAPEISFITEIENAIRKEESSWVSFEEFYSEFNKLSSEYWIVLRKKIHLLDDFLQTWETKLIERESSNFVAPLLEEIHKYKGIIPVLKHVRGEDFTEKHWTDVFNILEMDPKPVDQLQLNDFLQRSKNLEQFTKELQSISKRAASEIVIRQALKDIDHWDLQARFALIEHTDAKGHKVALIEDYKKHLNKIGDHQTVLQSIKSSPDYEAQSEKVKIWDEKLVNLSEYLTLLVQIQKKWTYLEPIFESGTLSQDNARFQKISKEFTRVLHYVAKEPRVTALCRFPNLKLLLQNALDQLLRCQHSLDNFLEEKRAKFPRFLFLNDEDLLEVVGQSSKEQVIQSHMKKIFSGIHSVNLCPNSEKIISICSAQGEIVTLQSPVYIRKPVEEWLNDLLKEMQNTLKEWLTECQKEGNAPDPLDYPSQILCLSNDINFTSKCEQAIADMNLPSLFAKYKAQLNHYTSLEVKGDDNSEHDNVLDLKLKALLLDTTHYINVIEELLKENISKVSDWVWQKQLRFYSNSLGDVTVKMANSRMEYSYEYLGNLQKLVRTPLTEKCFLTLTQSIYLGMGGNPYGPAGTGKTESIKSLGAMLGRQVLVFNCDEGTDVNSMTRILMGLAKTGAWGCFDEFNRLEEATLSAISMVIQPIQLSLKTNKSTVLLSDKEISLNKHCGIFVTLNPASENYGGRNKLPDNLKQLFRPVVMSHPDREQIARTLLRCDGFQNADLIATKLVEIFDMCSKLMSKQRHYDWGLRAIRSVLVGCGSAIRKLKRNAKVMVDADFEMTTVVGVLRVDVMSKLTFNDGMKFEKLMENVFKNVPNQSIEQQSLIKALEESCVEMDLDVDERQINKCLECYRQLKQRMGLAVVGPPSSGKSTIISLLRKALLKTGQLIKVYPLNPKSMSRQLLLGSMDNLNQWNGGVLTNYSIQATLEAPDTWTWILCDGDIDPEWVESLNSVLDDNRILSLPSGWRIQFGENVNFVFETHDLNHASPATVSRIGIVLLNSEDLPLDDYLNAFIKKLPQDDRDCMESNLREYFTKGIRWAISEGELSVSRPLISVARTGLSQLHAAKNRSQFVVGLINGIGQQLHEDFRENFGQLVFEWMNETAPPMVSRPYYDSDRDCIDSYHTSPSSDPAGELLLLTGQVKYYLSIIREWLDKTTNQHFLMLGPHGSAKRLMISHVIASYFDTEIVTIHCNAGLLTHHIIQKLLQHCLSLSTNKGKMLKPRRGRLILHFRNVHLLSHDKWGTSMVIEFLSQIIEFEGFFDSNTEFIRLENVTIVGSLSSANRLSSRFLSKLHVLSITLPDQEDLPSIAASRLFHAMPISNETWSKSNVYKLASIMAETYKKIRNYISTLRPKHYAINPHDLTRWCDGLIRYKNNGDTEQEQFMIEITCYEAFNVFSHNFVEQFHREKFCSILEECFNPWNVSVIIRDISLNNFFYVSMEPSIASSLKKLDKDDWQSMVDRGLHLFNRENMDLDIVVNEECLELTSNVVRATASEGSNVVMIGRPGVGRKSAVKIASALKSVKIVAPSTGMSPYFQNELKVAIHCAALECDNVYLLLEDHVFLNESNLNLVNTLITCGEAPDLYATTELEIIVKGLRERSNSENFEGDLIQFFYSNTKKNLHVIICFDELNENLSNILTYYPAFTQHITRLWKSRWNKESMDSLPSHLIKKLNTYDLEMNVSGKFGKIYETISKDIMAPSRYVAFVGLYYKIYQERLSSMDIRKKKLKSGVSKLTEARNLVAELKQKAADEQDKLAEKQSKANAALDMISKTMQNANTHKEEMESLKRKTEDENLQLMKRKKEIEDELSEVEPLIEEARSAVGNIKTESLSEIRSLRAPPEVIRDILEGVLKLMGTQDTSWNSMKTFLAKRGVKEEIRNLSNAKLHLVELTDELSDVDANVAKLKEQLSSFTKEAAEIEIGLDEVNHTLRTAQELVNKLDDEYQRWQKQLRELSIELGKLPNMSLLASAFITFLSEENESDRNKFLAKWCAEIGEEVFDLVMFLSSEREQLQWQSDGLANDKLSSQNVILMQKGNLTPLLIDPTSNALSWLGNHLKLAKKNVEYVTQNSPKFHSIVENALRFGKTLIVEEVETVDHILLPVLRDDFTVQGERRLMRLNGKFVDYGTDFKLILCTRNERFRLRADILPFVNIMNFNVTCDGFQEQLLSAAVRQEKPELENKRKQLLQEKEEMEEKQFQLQNRLLDDLADSSGNILQNKNLLESLNETKASSIAIAKALDESRNLEQDLCKEYDSYGDISEFGSKLYFACKEFSGFNIMYAISTKAFSRLFIRSLQTVQPLANDLNLQKKNLLHTVYGYMSRGVFKKDKLAFVLHLIHRLLPGEIPDEEFKLFLGIGPCRNLEDDEPPNWVPRQSGVALKNLKMSLPNLYDKLNLNESIAWKNFMSSSKCEHEFPSHCHLTAFQKVLVVQVLRPDRTWSTLEKCISTVTDIKMVDSAVLDLEQLAMDSESDEPILMLTSSGTDPSCEISDLAKARNFKYVEVSMGEGQEAKALEELEKCVVAGHWLILKNLHLVTYWLPVLSQHLKRLQTDNEFRLWLITEPCQTFNFVLAQNSLKVAYQEPQGLKNNLLRIYSLIEAKHLNILNNTSARILFAFACVHALLQERRNYIPQGWSKYYEFNNTDFNTCLSLIEDLWQNENTHVRWSFISGLMCDAVYGGRVENMDDMKILESYARAYFRDEITSHRWSPFDINTNLPNSAKIQDYIAAIKTFPNKDAPSAFGLPDNVNKAWEIQSSARLVAELKGFYSMHTQVGMATNEIDYKNLQPLLNLWKKVNHGLDFIRMTIPERENSASALETFLVEEVILAVELIQSIHKNFINLNNISKGFVEATDTDRMIALSLLNYKTPDIWLDKWKGPMDPNSYLQRLLIKAVAIQDLQKRDRFSFLQTGVNLAQFFCPEGFVAATKQDFSRNENVSLEEVYLETNWIRAHGDGLSITVSDLLIEGGILENGTLKPCSINSENIVAAPNCYLSWSAKRNPGDDKYIQVPLYESSNREKKVLCLRVPCALENKEKWTLASVALYMCF
ncbi:cytoplasmic dynein 2 heavy chain 1 isoform X2 [Cylas formicarius]|uniref:cytoplasmic dynein 2 heavy chain 1 isoform X2 n=1 Tax=Cylas formicarius TaxID=197179 RepID=UPI00295850BF|nr:cytoplasmic dynein 2 heavy chain 1 isoform X2 [Cylas formicarius]